MYRLIIFLEDDVAAALKSLAVREYRDVRLQATLLLKNALIDQGLMSTALAQGKSQGKQDSENQNHEM